MRWCQKMAGKTSEMQEPKADELTVFVGNLEGDFDGLDVGSAVVELKVGCDTYKYNGNDGQQ